MPSLRAVTLERSVLPAMMYGAVDGHIQKLPMQSMQSLGLQSFI